MLEKLYIENHNNTDLNMYRCGIEDCKPGHSWGPGIRDHYIVHHILKGKGVYKINDSVYNLSQYDGFLIPPNTIVYYQADDDDPWSYCWVGFHGLKAESYLKQADITPDNPIFRYYRDDFLKDSLNEMIEAKNMSKGRDIRLLGLLYSFLSRLIETADHDYSSKSADRKDLYIRKAVEFIAMSYSRKITVEEISHHVGLDRSYLYSIFNNFLKVSPQQFLINFRIEKACELMENNSLSIGDISRSVGYEDPLYFSKVFRKVKGMSPRNYRFPPAGSSARKKKF